MTDVKLDLEQTLCPAQGKAVLWMCNPGHEHLAYSMMHQNLWWILKEAIDVDPGRVHFYELSAFQSPQCEHVSWCNDPNEIIASMENSEFDSCVVFPLEYVTEDQAMRIVHDTVQLNGNPVNHTHTGGSWEHSAKRFVETAHRMGINVVIGSIHCPYRVIRRDYMPYLENVVPEMDLVIADHGDDVQIRTPAGEVLAERPWKELTEAPFIRIKSQEVNK